MKAKLQLNQNIDDQLLLEIGNIMKEIFGKKEKTQKKQTPIKKQKPQINQQEFYKNVALLLNSKQYNKILQKLNKNDKKTLTIQIIYELYNQQNDKDIQEFLYYWNDNQYRLKQQEDIQDTKFMTDSVKKMFVKALQITCYDYE